MIRKMLRVLGISLLILCLVPALTAATPGPEPAAAAAAGEPSVTVEKWTSWTNSRGAPYEEPAIPIPVGMVLYWDYYVKNTGGVPIERVRLSDDREGNLTGQLAGGDENVNNVLDPGEEWLFWLEGTATEGYYENTATVAGLTPEGVEVSASAKSHYYGVRTEGAIDLELHTNGEDADEPAGPEIPVGDEVIWTLFLTDNAPYPIAGCYQFDLWAGDTRDDISDEDYTGGDTNGNGIIDPGETFVYEKRGTAVEGQQTVHADAQLWLPGKIWVVDSDASHYVGVPGPAGPIPLPGFSAPPADPDGDGLYDDLNANGQTDFADVVIFFRQITWIEENEPVALFDYNRNGWIDFDDIVKLFRRI
jgi:PKD repeat protein